MKKNELKLCLALFGESEQPAGTPAGTPAGDAPQATQTGAQGEGVSAIPTREGRRQMIFPAVPRQEVRRPQAENHAARPAPTANTAVVSTPDSQAAAAEAPAETWETLIKGRYKEQYGQAIQAAVEKRFKHQADLQGQLDAAMNALRSIAPLYGMAGDESLDVNALAEKITDDDRLYEKAALEKGIPTETEKQIQALERRQKMLEAERRQSLEKEALRNHYAELRRQEAELKRDFPDFDLLTEAQNNPAFARMTALGGGLSVRQAYMAMHGDELMQRQAKETQEATKRTVSRAIQAGAMRPQENGMAQSGGGRTRIDPRTMTREQRAEINRRADAGEKIYFD